MGGRKGAIPAIGCPSLLSKFWQASKGRHPGAAIIKIISTKVPQVVEVLIVGGLESGNSRSVTRVEEERRESPTRHQARDKVAMTVGRLNHSFHPNTNQSLEEVL